MHRRAPQILYPIRETAPDDRELLKISDEVRINLRICKELGMRQQDLMRILGAAVKSECDGMPMMGLKTIMASHFDKLLLDMQNKEYQLETMSDQYRAHLAIADGLQKQWRLRFGEGYLEMDKTRSHRLIEKGGRLDGVEFNTEASPTALDLWRLKPQTPLGPFAELIGSLKLTDSEDSDTRNDDETRANSEDIEEISEGHWWPSLACARRDGFVPGSSGRAKGYSVTVLALVNGSELAYFPSATVEYVREGSTAEMCAHLISKVGTKMLILRGHGLESPFAPAAGIRYDGQYILRQYGQKLNPQTEVSRLSLVLERVPGQRSMHEILPIPRPSEMDDWLLIDKLEGELVRKRRGEEHFAAWKLARAKHRMDKDESHAKMEADCEPELREYVENKTADGKTESIITVHKIRDLKWEH